MILPIIVRRCLLGRVAERLFAPAGGEARALRAWEAVIPTRFERLPKRRVCGRQVPVATGFRSRLLGLAGLPRQRAGPGLLIPSCASVHTIGMRFALDLVFLDRGGNVLALHRAVPPMRLVRCPGAVEVLEIPMQGGESAGATT